MEPNNFEKFLNWINTSYLIKFFVMGFLILVLLIPLYMVQSLITERNYRQMDAVNEISLSWSTKQTIAGPVLSVPYKTFRRIERQDVDYQKNESKYEIKEFIEYAHFLPEQCKIKSLITPELRYRGIYEVVVYNSKHEFNGVFSKPDISELNIPEKDILWDKAFLSLIISDLRGIQENVKVTWIDSLCSFVPGITHLSQYNSGIKAHIPLQSENNNYNFQLYLDLNGSYGISFAPLSKESEIEITSGWKNPSFVGSFLPDYRTVNDSGFFAQWKILDLNRNFPQSWYGEIPDFNASLFGVDFFIPADHYQKSTRSSKYGILIITLTFLVFFFVEILTKKMIHPIQYLLVGLGLVLFYSLLFSVSEHMSFDLAYILAGIAIITMIGLYSISVFKNVRSTAILVVVLILLYTFNYTLLHLQDYALLIGNIGLFIILGVVMYLSKMIKWYKSDSIESSKIQRKE